MKSPSSRPRYSSSGNWFVSWEGAWNNWPCILTPRRRPWRSLIFPARRPRRLAKELAVMNHDATRQLVAEANKLARRVDSWISLSNALTDPQAGLIVRYFPSDEQRQEFLRSPEYEKLNQLLLRTIRR